MQNLLNQILKKASCCLHCGSFFSSESRLCSPCYESLQKLRNFYSDTKKYSAHRSLYRWNPGQSDILSRLILSLKGGGSHRTWQFYADEMLKDYFDHIALDKKIIVVPAAPSKKGQKDHAYEWAAGLAQGLGAELYLGLQKKNSKRQRSSDRGERALLEFEVCEINTSLSNDSTEVLWIFADDIITTGSTARAARLALGSPPHFEVWTLAERALSCGASLDLL